jgi:hypothetical protein
MRYCVAGAIVSFAALVYSCVCIAQNTPANPPQGGAEAGTLFSKLKNNGSGGPAPKRDLTGSWAGPISIDSLAVAPPLTPLGQKIMSGNKPETEFHISGTNDTFARMCDPLGFPRNIVFEIRGLSFATMPDRLLVLNQYQRAWREIWMDGRELPKNVGGKDAPDPRYYGYSAGHWEDDYTLVVDTSGLDDRTWLTRKGYPHTVNAHVRERYVRMDHNDLQLTVTVDDPTIYADTFKMGTTNFKWVPNQQLDEQLCIPSEMLQYLNLIGDPAGSGVPPTN